MQLAHQCFLAFPKQSMKANQQEMRAHARVIRGRYLLASGSGGTAWMFEKLSGRLVARVEYPDV
jgi:hypothetical protein